MPITWWLSGFVHPGIGILAWSSLPALFDRIQRSPDAGMLSGLYSVIKQLIAKCRSPQALACRKNPHRVHIQTGQLPKPPQQPPHFLVPSDESTA
ncbi:hypothetical protein BDV10DRAFT_93830 [Aspergillus recurvatus]